MAKVIDLECPGCGTALSMDMKFCPSCCRPLVISSLGIINNLSDFEIKKQKNYYDSIIEKGGSNSDVFISIAMCNLRLGIYQEAKEYFKKAITSQIQNPDLYFYVAICSLDGKKPFLQKRTTINEVLDYLETAIKIERKGIYYYFVAYIKKDYFERKFLRSNPNSDAYFEKACEIGLSQADIDLLHDMMNKRNENIF